MKTGIFYLITLIILLCGCEGPVGPDGADGPRGPEGKQGRQGQEGVSPEIKSESRSGRLDKDGEAIVYFPGMRLATSQVNCWSRINNESSWLLIASDVIFIDGEYEIVTLCTALDVQGNSGTELGVLIQGFPDWQYLVVALSSS